MNKEKILQRLCNDEDYDYKETNWFIFGRNKFVDTKWSEEILRLKLNNDSITEALIDFVHSLFK